jgi:YebC/PmpR family DNA-binding regulatory protein
MSGHSKWSTIKRKKGAADAKRGQIFTRFMREITVAAKMGGGDIDGNSRLRTAVDAARAQNMPKDNIERAIAKGVGDMDGVSYEEITYEGYGPNGVGFIIEVMTDNKNRAAAEVRHILTKRGGVLAKSGAVSYLFESKGLFMVEKSEADEDKIMEVALEMGAEDVQDADEMWEIHTLPADFSAVAEALKAAGIKAQEASLSKLPATTVAVTDPGDAKKVLALMEALDECDDVQNVYANFDIDDSVMDAIDG